MRMLALLFRNLRWRKGRVALLILGAAVLSTGLAYLAVLSDSMRVAVDATLAEKWRTSYDILVRPATSAGSVEQEGQLVAANFLSGQKGGITLEQLAAIRAIPGVTLAAPEAVLGHVMLQTNIDVDPPKDPGLYRVTASVSSFDGLRTDKATSSSYQAYYPEPLTAEGKAALSEEQTWRQLQEQGVRAMFMVTPTGDGNVGPFYNRAVLGYPVLLVAVDPAAEAQLVGLDKAVTDGRYLTADDKPVVDTTHKVQVAQVPVLMSTQPSTQMRYQLQYEKLIDGPIQPSNLLAQLQAGKLNLGQSSGTAAGATEIGQADLRQRLLTTLTTADRRVVAATSIYVQPTPLAYEQVQSPSVDWPLAVELKPVGQAKQAFYLGTQTTETSRVAYRPAGEPAGPFMVFQMVGQYAPNSLKNIVQDDANAVPMETYKPEAGTLRYDLNGQPVSPIDLQPGDNPQDAFLSPPTLITTLDVAQQLMQSTAVISDIRVRVTGSTDLSEATQARVQQVAAEIARQTGLQADIMVGSSPRKLLVKIPGWEHLPGIGYVAQLWVQKGAQILIYREVNRGDALLLLLVLIVGIVYVLATAMVSVLSRQRELALMSALGWSPGSIFRSVMAETALSAIATAVVGIAAAYLVGLIGHLYMPPARILLTGVITAAVYLLGALGPAFLAGRTKPMGRLRQGEMAKRAAVTQVQSLLGLAVANAVIRWRRNLVSVAAIGVPTALLGILLFVTIRLKGILALTVVGQDLLLQLGWTQVIALAVAFLLAMLTVADLLWLNIMERTAELSLLSALGWSQQTIRTSILTEGALIGVVGGLLGLTGDVAIVAIYYPTAVTALLPLAVVILAVPILMGAIGAAVPAEAAVRIQPAEGLRTE